LFSDLLHGDCPRRRISRPAAWQRSCELGAQPGERVAVFAPERKKVAEAFYAQIDSMYQGD
jgi:hypothetical protein